MSDTIPNQDLGEFAYRGYYEKCGGKSLISGLPLPEWSDQDPTIRAAWEAAAQAVVEATRQDYFSLPALARLRKARS